MKPFIILCLSGIALTAYTQTAVSTQASLTHATVYYGKGSELEHTAKAALIKGSQEVVISNISLSVDVNTIQVACPESISILSYQHRVFTEPVKSIEDDVINKMLDSIRLLNKQIAALDNDYYIQNEVLSKTTSLIEKNITALPEKSISSAELIKLIDYYSNKIELIKSSMFLLTNKKQGFTDSINQINSRIAVRKQSIIQPAPKPTGQLVMQVIANAAGSADFAVSYFTPQAGWLPAYDLRVKSIDNSFKVVYKATVQQSTGIDWSQVKLSLSTGNPNQQSAAPVMNPWFVSLYMPQLARTLDEVAVTGYGLNKRSMVQTEVADTYEKPGREKREAYESLEGTLVDAYTTLSESQLNVNFDIDLPYDIASGGKPVSVSIKDESVKATYKHFVVPKLDHDAFLVADISDWANLDLMPGEANIIMDNVYLGKSFINPNTTADTLSISLGRDKRIAVNRLPVKEFSKSKQRGDNKTDAFTYEIGIKNNKVKAIDIVVMDQYPVSKIKDVEVSLTDKGQAEINEETGALTWKIKLDAGESKKLRFGYTINYPKDKRLSML